MAWYDQDSWLTAAFSPNLTTIVITIVVALALPILLHAFLYKKAAAAAQVPTVLLVGPSGSGKTAFATLVQPPPCPSQRHHMALVANRHTGREERLYPDTHVDHASYRLCPSAQSTCVRVLALPLAR